MRQTPEDAIRQVVEQHAAAWNRYDMSAYAALFTEDADLVNIRGGWWQGRAQIEERMAALHTTRFRTSHLRPTEIAIRFLDARLAIVHARWHLTGTLSPDEQPVTGIQQTITTWTLVLRDDTWQIRAFQNTEILAPPAVRSG
ncbi:MAG TPA: SgcJ/EcaC family oxidoreductase [Chloroflexia bacterium]|nr:SgcJ/EcaC family oxidoreductase [Chloroflexia bacterium]